MIFFTQEMLHDKDYFISIIKEEKVQINSMIEAQKALKSIILNWMQSFASSDETNNHNNIDAIFTFLSNLKNSLKLCNESLELLGILSKSIDTMILDLKNNDNISHNFCNDYNTTFLKSNETLLKNSIEVEKFFSSIIPLSRFDFLNNNKSDSIEIEPNNVDMVNSSTFESSEKAKLLELPIDANLIQDVDITNYVENTLIISESKGNVFLPYTLSTLNTILKQNPDKYSSIQDIINQEYSLPFEIFKNPAVARFREAFKLMRKKEKSSIKEAFDLSMELFFNYNLHPAIISACRNSDELDIYLDYLENNETHKFDCFKIVFDMAPALIKKTIE